MSDRNDPSQYLTDQTNDNDVSFYGDTSVESDQIQEQVQGEYATEEELTSLTDPAATHDYMKENPGAYRTATVRKKTRLVAQARPFPYASNQMINGAGVLRGVSLASLDATPFTVNLRDGADANAPLLMVLTSTIPSVAIFPIPVQFRYGLYFELATGTAIAGVIYTDELQD